jgi:hypothetical protein
MPPKSASVAVEGGDGNDHKDIEIVFAAKSLFIPAHRALEAVHRVEAPVLFSGLHIYLERDLAAGHSGEAVFDVGKLATHEREQIGGLLERIVPHGEMPSGAGHVALGNEIAVGQQHRCFAFVGFDARGIDRHDVRPVKEIGDAAKALGFALGAIGLASAVQPHELRVAHGIDNRLDFKLEWAVRRLRNGESVGSGDEVFRWQLLAVDCQRNKLQVFAVENERRRRTGRIRFDLELGAHSGGARVKRHVEVDGLDQPVGRAVILQ